MDDIMILYPEELTELTGSNIYSYGYEYPTKFNIRSFPGQVEIN